MVVRSSSSPHRSKSSCGEDDQAGFHGLLNPVAALARTQSSAKERANVDGQDSAAYRVGRDVNFERDTEGI